MKHVFVESNWLFAYAAPAHHKSPDAVELFERAGRGEFMLHMPNICIGEARQAIRAKCQPRNEVNAVRRFVSWAEPARIISERDAASTKDTLEKYRQNIERELGKLDDIFRDLAQLSYFKIFALDDEMLDLSTKLALDGIAMNPFDHAILAGVLVSSSRLWAAEERGISFCERDADLQPWDRDGQVKPLLQAAYDRAHLWVYGDFTLVWPERDVDFE